MYLETKVMNDTFVIDVPNCELDISAGTAGVPDSNCASKRDVSKTMKKQAYYLHSIHKSVVKKSKAERLAEPLPEDVGLNVAEQVRGSLKGGLIPILSVEWSQAARDDTTDIAELVGYAEGAIKPDAPTPGAGEKKRGFYFPNYGYDPLIENLGGVQGSGRVCIHKLVDATSPILLQYATDNSLKGDIRDTVCPPPQAFFVLLSLDIQRNGAAETLFIILDGAVVQSYALNLNGTDPNGNVDETICFWSPLTITSYANPVGTSDAFEENMSFTCEPNFCEEYCCVCGSVCFGAGGALVNAFCGTEICQNIPWQAACFAHLPGGYELLLNQGGEDGEDYNTFRPNAF